MCFINKLELEYNQQCDASLAKIKSNLIWMSPILGLAHFFCFGASITLNSVTALSNPHWDCNRRTYKARGCVNPHHIQRLQGPYIIHVRRRWTDWIVTAGTGERNERLSLSLSAEKWGEKMLISVWIMFGQQGAGGGGHLKSLYQQIFSLLKLAWQFQFSSVMLLTLTFDLPVEEGWVKRESAACIYICIQYQFFCCCCCIRFMFSCMLLIPTMSLVNSSLFRWG